MRSANPALNNNTFRNTRRVSGEQAMSIDGTVNKTALSPILFAFRDFNRKYHFVTLNRMSCGSNRFLFYFS